MRKPKQPAPTVATLGQLQRTQSWYWMSCGSFNACGYSVAVALAPFVIPWGAEASSDKPRQNFLCSKCGHKGGMMTHPSFVDTIVGTEPFPAPAAR